METFFTELRNLAESHARITSEKVKTGEEFNKLLTQYLKGQTEDVEKIEEAQKANQLAQAKGSEIFMTIMQKVMSYINEKKINFQQMEAQLRDKNLSIYLIARKYSPDASNKNFECKLHGVAKPFECNYVVTTDRKFYLSELKKFGYNSIEENFHNLADAGVFGMKEELPKDDMKKAMRKIRPEDSLLLKEDVEKTIKDLEKA